MATKSITKVIRIRDKRSVRNLVHALEHSHEKVGGLSEIDVTSHDLRGEELIKAFQKERAQTENLKNP